MTYRVAYDIDEELADAGAVTEFFNRREQRVAPHGRRANRFAPSGGEDVLRADIDFDAGRAALRWLPDGAFAADLEPGEPIVVLESSDFPPVTIPGTLVRGVDRRGPAGDRHPRADRATAFCRRMAPDEQRS